MNRIGRCFTLLLRLSVLAVGLVFFGKAFAAQNPRRTVDPSQPQTSSTPATQPPTELQQLERENQYLREILWRGSGRTIPFPQATVKGELSEQQRREQLIEENQHLAEMVLLSLPVPNLQRKADTNTEMSWMPAILALFGSLVVVLMGMWLNTKALSNQLDALRAEMKQGLAEFRIEMLTPIQEIKRRVERLEEQRGLFRP
jgi:hypothetical protein